MRPLHPSTLLGLCPGFPVFFWAVSIESRSRKKVLGFDFAPVCIEDPHWLVSHQLAGNMGQGSSVWNYDDDDDDDGGDDDGDDDGEDSGDD